MEGRVIEKLPTGCLTLGRVRLMCARGWTWMAVVVGIVVLSALAAPNVCHGQECGTYAYCCSECDADEDADYTEEEDEGEDFRLEVFAAECITSKATCEATSVLHVYDAELWESDQGQGGGSASCELTHYWEWDGAPGTAPGASYDVNYDGEGDASGAGTAVADWCITGAMASSSCSGTTGGSGSATGGGATQPSASVQNCGGGCTYSTTGSLSGAVSGSPAGAGISASVSGGGTGTGSYAQTGMWDINYQGEGAVGSGGTTIIVTSKVNCVTLTTAAADGCFLGPAKGEAATHVEAVMAASAYNIVAN